jgi:hypothetical protein
MGWLIASVQFLPFMVASCVLGGVALAGWRRTGETGALLIAVAAGLRVLHDLVAVWNLWRLWNQGSRASYLTWLTAINAVQWVGGLIGAVLLIVGAALVLRRLPARAV